MNRSLACVFAASVLVACSGAPQRFTPLASDPSSQFVRTNNLTGGRFLLSVGASSRVFLMQLDDEAYDRWGPTFQIKLANDGPAPIAFGVGNIKVRQDGEFLQVHGAERIAAATEEEPGRREAMTLPALAVSGAATPIATDAAPGRAAETAAFRAAATKTHLFDVKVPPGREHAALISVPDLDDDGPAEFTIQVDFDRHRMVFEPD